MIINTNSTKSSKELKVLTMPPSQITVQHYVKVLKSCPLFHTTGAQHPTDITRRYGLLFRSAVGTEGEDCSTRTLRQGSRRGLSVAFPPCVCQRFSSAGRTSEPGNVVPRATGWSGCLSQQPKPWSADCSLSVL